MSTDLMELNVSEIFLRTQLGDRFDISSRLSSSYFSSRNSPSLLKPSDDVENF